MGAIEIEKLGGTGIHDVRRFALAADDHLPLKIFIRRQARASATDLLTQTYVAKRLADGRVVGFVSLMCAEVKFDAAFAGNPYQLQPALRIARLAVEDGCRGERIGQALLQWATAVALVEILPRVGCRFIIVDAKRDSVAFYEHHGFRQVDTDDNRRRREPIMFLDLKPLA